MDPQRTARLAVPEVSSSSSPHRRRHRVNKFFVIAIIKPSASRSAQSVSTRPPAPRRTMSRVHAPVGAATAVAPGAPMPQTRAARTASAAGSRAAATAASAAQADSRTGQAAQRGAPSSRPTPRTGSRPHRGRSADGAELGGERRPWRFENQPRSSTQRCDQLLDRAARADVEAEKAAGQRGEVREIVDHRVMVDGINCALAPALADARVYDEDYIVLSDRRGPATAAARLDRTWPAWDAATFEHLLDMWRVRDPSTGQVCARGFAHACNALRARGD